MSPVDDDARAVLALTNRLVDAGAEPLLAGEVWALLDAVEQPGALLGASAAAIGEALGTGGPDPVRLARLLDPGVGLAVRLAALADQGVWALTAVERTYPMRLRDRLGAGAPAVLWGVGSVDLLGTDGVGIVAEADADEPGESAVAVAAGLATLAADLGYPVVTTAGTGAVDVVAGQAAAEAGGAAVGVPAEALTEVAGRAEVRRGVLDGRTALCTPYHPDAGATDGRVRGCRKVAHALAELTVVVACDDGTGPTWAAAADAVADDRHRLAVWRADGEGPGNAALETLGATPVHDLDEVATLLESGLG